jgi:hypothetical protein
MIVPMNLEFVLRVVAPFGVQNTFQADAPLANVTIELASALSAPSILKIYVPLPLRIIPDVPIDATPSIQYTPGV